jgi:broad specificity phosphatase PhoE
LCQQVAALLRAEPIDAIFVSPWLRAIQTAAPLAAEKGLQLTVDRCLGEYLLAEGGHFAEDPLPHLVYESSLLRARAASDLPHVSASLLAADIGSPFPRFPEEHQSALERHEQALGRVLSTVGHPGEGTVLIVGHGATNDFCIHALCGEGKHPTGRFSQPGEERLPPPPHVCLTTIVCGDDLTWKVESYGQPTVTSEHTNSPATTPKL